MKKKLLLLIPCVIGLNVHAASVNVTSSANYIEAGNRVTFYINMQGVEAWSLQGNGYGATSNCSLGDNGTGDSGTGTNINKTLSVTCTSTSVGQIGFSITGNVSSVNSDKIDTINVNTSKIVTVTAPREKDTNNYLKSILKSIVGKKVFFINKKAIKIKLKKTNIENLYIKKEIRNLLKHPIFFMQTVFPVIMILLTIIFIGNTLIPVFNNILENDQTLSRELATIDFNSELIVVILGILQVLFSISNLSITAVSRDGRDAVFMKYIPLDLYKQFKCKNVLQIMLNVIVAIIVLGMIYFYIPKIGIINIILLFIVSICINIINSYLMLIIDLRRPYLNWTSEHSVVKKNDNKSFQYAFTIIMILLYMYISNICKNLNVQITLIGEIIFFTSIIILIKIIVKKNIQKLFNKIN